MFGRGENAGPKLVSSPAVDSYETEEKGGNVDVDRMLSTMKVRYQSSWKEFPLWEDPACES
jgi:hypothetical protein